MERNLVCLQMEAVAARAIGLRRWQEWATLILHRAVMTVEKMIASVDRGIYVKSINAGSVNSITGEFNFNTGETFLIEHGEITVPVHSATLIGTGGDILQKSSR